APAVRPGPHHGEIPAREQLGERARREQELELATGAELVEVAQPRAQPRPLLVERLDAPLEIGARGRQIAVERLAAPLECLQPLARRRELAVGAPELHQL